MQNEEGGRMINISIGTDMEDIISDIGYDEIRRMYASEIDSEIEEAREAGYEEGYDAKEQEGE